MWKSSGKNWGKSGEKVVGNDVRVGDSERAVGKVEEKWWGKSGS
jgi:hypothetical protein